MNQALGLVDSSSLTRSVVTSVPSASVQSARLQVSVVIPTFNESKNVRTIIERISKVLDYYKWEVIFVDDNSPDKTWKVVTEIAKNDQRVRCIRRIKRRGLSGACIEGILSSTAPVVVVMDGDLQHDENILPKMIKAIEQNECDLAVGSRYVHDDVPHEGLNKRRLFASKLATKLARQAFHTEVKDLMSGFFAIRRSSFEDIAENLVTSGFKILLDIIMTAKTSIRITEVAYRFRERHDGISKFDVRAMWDFVGLVIHRMTRGIIPVRFVEFLCVGCLGIVVHLAVLKSAIMTGSFDFQQSQTVASIVAMTSNFYINNLFTYRDKKLKGVALVRGLLLFCIICSAGAVSNIGIASWLFGRSYVWWLSGLAGAMIGAVWNYVVSSALVWRR